MVRELRGLWFPSKPEGIRRQLKSNKIKCKPFNYSNFFVYDFINSVLLAFTRSSNWILGRVKANRRKFSLCGIYSAEYSNTRPSKGQYSRWRLQRLVLWKSLYIKHYKYQSILFYFPHKSLNSHLTNSTIKQSTNQISLSPTTLKRWRRLRRPLLRLRCRLPTFLGCISRSKTSEMVGKKWMSYATIVENAIHSRKGADTGPSLTMYDRSTPIRWAWGKSSKR